MCLACALCVLCCCRVRPCGRQGIEKRLKDVGASAAKASVLLSTKCYERFVTESMLRWANPGGGDAAAPAHLE